jgi:XTP/dITP diphosphohydrolase
VARVPALVLASRNAGKLRELRRLLGPGWDLRPLPEGAPEPAEDGDTYAENALAKAMAAARHTGAAALADDSGIEIDACRGHPGVRSARWAPPEEQNRAILDRLRDVPEERRGAAMRAVVAVALPDGRHALAEGVVRGAIARAPRGRGGFGYDPIFLLPDGRTLAEVDDREKDAVGHRGQAVRALLPALGRLLPPTPQGLAPRSPGG